MDIEQLKLIVEAVSGLGEDAKYVCCLYIGYLFFEVFAMMAMVSLLIHVIYKGVVRGYALTLEAEKLVQLGRKLREAAGFSFWNNENVDWACLTLRKAARERRENRND